MAQIKELAKRRTDVYDLDPADIQEVEGWNVRNPGPELDAHIRQLADSIKEVGVLEPVTVYMRDGIPTLVNGHCRLMALRLAMEEGAEIRTVPARMENKWANDADRVLAMITRNSGKPLSPLEMAEVVKRLLSFGWSESEVAKKTAFSGTHIKNLLSLGAMPEQAKEMVRNGEVAPRTAVEVIKKEGEQKGTETLKKAVETAKEQGKVKATPKHLPKEEKTPQETVLDTLEQVDKAHKAADKSTLAFPGKEAGKVTPLPKAADTTNWAIWSPRMVKLLQKIRDVDSIGELQQLQSQVGPFLSGMAKNPSGR